MLRENKKNKITFYFVSNLSKQIKRPSVFHIHSYKHPGLHLFVHFCIFVISEQTNTKKNFKIVIFCWDTINSNVKLICFFFFFAINIFVNGWQKSYSHVPKQNTSNTLIHKDSRMIFTSFLVFNIKQLIVTLYFQFWNPHI